MLKWEIWGNANKIINFILIIKIHALLFKLTVFPRNGLRITKFFTYVYKSLTYVVNVNRT